VPPLCRPPRILAGAFDLISDFAIPNSASDALVVLRSFPQQLEDQFVIVVKMEKPSSTRPNPLMDTAR
jgi:hypothetical protein